MLVLCLDLLNSLLIFSFLYICLVGEKPQCGRIMNKTIIIMNYYINSCSVSDKMELWGTLRIMGETAIRF